jgi:hypothetical protein
LTKSAAFDPEAWEQAREVLEGDLPIDPSELGGEVMQELALRLCDSDWTYREIAAALGVGKSTVGRWIGPSPVASDPANGTGVGLVGLLLGAGAVAAILKAALDKNPSRRPARRPMSSRGDGDPIHADGPEASAPASDEGS